MKGRAVTWMRRLTAVAGLSLLTLTARAEYVECESAFSHGIPLQSISHAVQGGLPDLTNFVKGSSLDVTSFNLSSAGRLTVQLADLGFPRALNELSVLVTDLHGLWQRVDAAGTTASLLLDISGPTQLFAAVFARSEDSRTPGLYALNANFAPVPLPAAAWLLLSGLVGVGAAARRRK